MGNKQKSCCNAKDASTFIGQLLSISIAMRSAGSRSRWAMSRNPDRGPLLSAEPMYASDHKAALATSMNLHVHRRRA